MGDKDQTATFTAKMQDEVSGAAETAAHALEGLQDRIAADTKELGLMNKAMKDLQSASVVNVATFKRLQGSIDAKKGALAQARAQYVNLGGGFETVAKKVDPVAAKIRALEAAITKAKAPERLKQLQLELANIGKPAVVSSMTKAQNAIKTLGEQASNVGGPLGQMGGALRYVGGLLKTHWLAVLIGVGVAVMTAFTVGIVKVTHALYEYGVAHANAYRAERLHLEGFAKIRTPFTMGMGLKEMKGTELQSAIDRVSAKVSIGREKIASYGESLYAAGVRGKNFETALEGMSIKGAAQGDAQAQLFKGWATYYALSGQRVDKLTDKVKSRLGGIVKAQMLDATVQAQKLEEAYAALFTDLKIEPLLKAKAEIFALFSQTTESGKAIKSIVKDIVQPWIDLQTVAAPYIKRFFQGVIIGALLVQIAFIRLKKDWHVLFGAKAKGDIDGTMEAMQLGIKIVGGFGHGLLLVARGLMYVAYAMKVAKPALDTVGNFASSGGLSLGSGVSQAGFMLGGQLWKGFSDGVLSGEDPVRESMAKLAKQAEDELRDGLVIRSPSQVFRALGREIPAGLKLGIADGTPEARKAAGAMIPPSSAGELAGPKPGGGGMGKSVSVNLGGVHVHLERRTGDDASAIGNAVKQKLEQILQGVAIELGGSEAPA